MKPKHQTHSKTTSRGNNQNEQTEQTSDICIVMADRECVAARLHPGHPRPHHVQSPLTLLHFHLLHNQQHLLRRHLPCAATESEKSERSSSQQPGQITERILVGIIQYVLGFFSLFVRDCGGSRILQPRSWQFFPKTACKLKEFGLTGDVGP